MAIEEQKIGRDAAQHMKQGASVEHMTGGKIPYPKHVWSPAGGWYAQPANWKANTAVAALVGLVVVGSAFAISAEREHRTKFPEPGRFFPSRYWSRQIREHEREQALKNREG